MAVRNAAVAAAGRWTDPDDGVRYPTGDVHAWERGRNETVCGLSLCKSRLDRFPHVTWADVQPESGGHAEEVQSVCRRCRAALGARRGRPRLDADQPPPLRRLSAAGTTPTGTAPAAAPTSGVRGGCSRPDRRAGWATPHAG
jgi:hypothetical protein